jgi:regulatory protein
MLITDIEEISKTKVKVSTDDGESFPLYKSELRTYNVRVDCELPSETYDTIINDILVKRAKLRCMNLLKSRDYTRYMLQDKLIQGGYPKSVIDIALEYVASYGYIDDIRYAVSYIKYAGNTKSVKQIKNVLVRKGISSEDMDAAFGECEKNNDIKSQAELIERFIEKKHYDKNNSTYEEKQKIIGFLYRKGFSLDLIYKAVE